MFGRNASRFPLRALPAIFPAMDKRRKIRELAMQIVYLWDSHGGEDRAMADQSMEHGTDDLVVRQSALEMAQGAWEQRTNIDAQLERLAPQWPVRRQPAVDRALLRVAIWELQNVPTPPKVVLDEAIELAKAFSTENSPAFINGVLDAVLREINSLKQE